MEKPRHLDSAVAVSSAEGRKKGERKKGERNEGRKAKGTKEGVKEARKKCSRGLLIHGSMSVSGGKFFPRIINNPLMINRR